MFVEYHQGRSTFGKVIATAKKVDAFYDSQCSMWCVRPLAATNANNRMSGRLFTYFPAR